jgi:hypothetical protein
VAVVQGLGNNSPADNVPASTYSAAIIVMSQTVSTISLAYLPCFVTLQPKPDVQVTQSVTPTTASLQPGNQPLFTFTAVVSAAAGSGYVNGVKLDVALPAGLERLGDIAAAPDGEI